MSVELSQCCTGSGRWLWWIGGSDTEPCKSWQLTVYVCLWSFWPICFSGTFYICFIHRLSFHNWWITARVLLLDRGVDNKDGKRWISAFIVVSLGFQSSQSCFGTVSLTLTIGHVEGLVLTHMQLLEVLESQKLNSHFYAWQPSPLFWYIGIHGFSDLIIGWACSSIWLAYAINDECVKIYFCSIFRKDWDDSLFAEHIPRRTGQQVSRECKIGWRTHSRVNPVLNCEFVPLHA